jgi:hypothetical protein
MNNAENKDIEGFLDSLHQLYDTDPNLQETLKDCPNWQTRWNALEVYVLTNLNRTEMNYGQYTTLWLREQFFYEMQEKTGMDFGFCPHFTPAFKARGQSILDDTLGPGLDNLCGYNVETPVMTTCSGTDRDSCIILHPKLKQESDELFLQYLMSQEGY